MSDSGISTDGQGFLVGVQPATPQATQGIVTPLRPDQQVSQPIAVVPQQPQPNGARWSDEDLERARTQEKEKLYPRIEEMGEQLKALRAERDAELAERQRVADEAQAALRAKEESEMEVRDLMARRESEFQAQIDALNSRYDTDRAIFERERQLHDAQQYRQARIEQEAEFILPELRDFVAGDSPEEIDASIEEIKARSEAIFANMSAAMQPQPFRPAAAAMPSVPPVGPMEQLPSYESLTPEDIKGMDMNTYKRYREQLLQATSPNRQRGR